MSGSKLLVPDDAYDVARCEVALVGDKATAEQLRIAVAEAFVSGDASAIASKWGVSYSRLISACLDAVLTLRP